MAGFSGKVFGGDLALTACLLRVEMLCGELESVTCGPLQGSPSSNTARCAFASLTKILQDDRIAVWVVWPKIASREEPTGRKAAADVIENRSI